jgi:hypothetical protein
MDKRTTHGESYSRAYNIWAMMRQRCGNPRAANYVLYGGRGIKCCEQWSAFSVFLKDMGHPPDPSDTLDRVDTDGDYTPENCRWADPITQACNRRNGVRITANGKTQSMSQWCRETGKSRSEVGHRLNVLKLSPEEALALPKMSWVQRPVRRTNLDGSNVQRFDSLASSAKISGVTKGSLWAALKRPSPVEYSGYLWAYDD